MKAYLGSTIIVQDPAATDPLGTGKLELDGGRLSIAASSATLANNVSFSGNLTIGGAISADGTMFPFNGTLVFDDDVTMIEPSTVALKGSGEVDFAAGNKLQGAGLTFGGGVGRLGLFCKTFAEVSVVGTAGSSPLTVLLGGNLKGTGSVEVGANVTALLDGKDRAGNVFVAKGAGTLHVKGGSVVVHAEHPKLTGQVSLEQGQIVLNSSKTLSTPLGTGSLEILGGILDCETPESLSNPVNLKGSATLRINSGPLNFIGSVTVSSGAGISISGTDPNRTVKFQGSLTGPLKINGPGSQVYVKQAYFSEIDPNHPGVTVTAF